MKTKTINGHPFVAYTRDTYEANEMIERSSTYFHWLDTRRTVRDYADKPVPKEVIENIIKSASTAPSGAHKQPWVFCVVSSPALKKKIRIAAEEEEKESYAKRMSDEWLEDLEHLGTNWEKPFLEVAPYLIIVFKKAYGLDENENKSTNYYVNESVGLASGFLLTAIHNAGLVGLTHTPSPMAFLTKILNRPANERPFLLIPVGYPAKKTYVPQLTRKPLDEVSVFYE
ncbi:MAG: nitroreductase family protein [Cyclobacteriaceae bacterium]|nr:nitroreductase family protein [Cyclobacteriaceae bacterium]